MNNIEIRKLDGTLLLVFLGLIKHGKAVAVAADLGMTSSAISHALNRLREIFRDPLFLRKPHGLMPTAYALELEPRIREVYEILDKSLSGPDDFDPATSDAVLRIAAFDLELSIVIPELTRKIHSVAPNIRIIAVADGRQSALNRLREGTADLAIGFYADLPADLSAKLLYREDFAVTAQEDVFCGNSPDLETFAAQDHVVVSPAGDLSGVVDEELAKHGRSRHVVLSVPLFFPALAAVQGTRFVTTLPSRFAEKYAPLFGLETYQPPLEVRNFSVSAVWHRRNDRNTLLQWLIEKL